MTKYEIIAELLNKYGISLKKSLGQNFMLDPEVPSKMADACAVSQTDGVLEIGPGAGALTGELVQRAGKVAAVELDGRLMPLLKDTLSGYDNLTLIQADALKLDYAELAAEYFSGLRPLAIANLPYYITTPLLEKLMTCRVFSRICVLVQKEAAQRVIAKPNDTQFNAFSVMAAYYSKPGILFDVPRSSFIPQPAVDSSVLMLEMRSASPDGIESSEDEKLFKLLVRAAFGERRKVFAGNIAKTLGGERELYAGMLSDMGFPPDVRGERLAMQDYIALVRKIRSLK